MSYFDPAIVLSHLTAREVSVRLGCKAAQVRLLHAKKLLPGYSISPKDRTRPRLRWTEDVVAAFQAASANAIVIQSAPPLRAQPKARSVAVPASVPLFRAKHLAKKGA